MKPLCFLLLMTLAGCGHFIDTPDGAIRIGDPNCQDIHIKAYPPQFELRLTAEVGTAPKSSVWPQIVTDYRNLRTAVRACQGKDEHGAPLNAEPLKKTSSR